jgi:uncharacterized protein (DUF1501 family)
MMPRRLFLKSSGVFLISQFALPRLLSQALGANALTTPSPALLHTAANHANKILVVIFQRGAVDGLSMVPPIGDEHYNSTIRPSILIPAKGDLSAIPLDGYFGLHPGLSELAPFWNDGRLAVVHQVGSPDNTRSHFDAQDFMESGTPGVKSTEDGFLDRALLALPADKTQSVLRAIAMQPNLPRSLWGTAGAIAMNSLQQFSGIGALSKSGVSGGFESMYDSAMDEALRGAGQNTFQAIKTISAIPDSPNAGEYPKSPLGKHLSEIAKLIRGQVGLRVAVTDCGGWDTHQRQGAGKGQLEGHLQDLSKSIAAFTHDLGAKMDDVVLVTMTEFGRTVKENGNGGTDHGHGSAMFVLGGGVRGKRVISHWKSLALENLYEQRDLPVTTDFRDVWLEILGSHLGVAKRDSIFPKFQAGAKPGLFKV